MDHTIGLIVIDHRKNSPNEISGGNDRLFWEARPEPNWRNGNLPHETKEW